MRINWLRRDVSLEFVAARDAPLTPADLGLTAESVESYDASHEGYLFFGTRNLGVSGSLTQVTLHDQSSRKTVDRMARAVRAAVAAVGNEISTVELQFEFIAVGDPDDDAVSEFAFSLLQRDFVDDVFGKTMAMPIGGVFNVHGPDGLHGLFTIYGVRSTEGNGINVSFERRSQVSGPRELRRVTTAAALNRVVDHCCDAAERVIELASHDSKVDK